MFDQEGREVRKLMVDQTFNAAFGDVTDFGSTNAQEVKRLCHRLTMEVTAGNNLGVGDDNRVIGGGIQLDGDFRCHVVDGVFACAVNLRHTTERVGILRAQFGGVGQVGRAFRQVADVLCGRNATGVRTNGVQFLIESIDDAAMRFEREGTGDIRQF